MQCAGRVTGPDNCTTNGHLLQPQGRPCHPAGDRELEGEDQEARALGEEDLALAPGNLKEKAQAVEVKVMER